jgi:hypothetical protein
MSDDRAKSLLVRAIQEYDSSGDYWFGDLDIDVNVSEVWLKGRRVQINVVAYRYQSVLLTERWQTLGHFFLREEVRSDI